MLKYEAINDPTSVENFFCENFKRKNPVELSMDLRDTILTLLMSHEKSFNSIPDKAKPYQLKIVENAIQGRFSFITDDSRVSLFILSLGITPGICTMLLTMVQYFAKKIGQKNINLDFICQNVFPVGIPSEEDLQELWEAQKVEKPSGGSANLLDYQTAMKSIQFL
jgi:hypothetical protein